MERPEASIALPIIPAQAGIQCRSGLQGLDPCMCRDDASENRKAIA